jgi:hypothetical protein
MKSTLLGIMLLTSTGLLAQNNKKLAKAFTGVWELVTVKSVAADSNVSYPYGEHPAGTMILDNNGYYSLQIYGEGRTKIASGSKNTATPEENIMLVKKSNAHYGSYTIDGQNGAIIFKPAYAFFPNWEGQELKHSYTLENGILTYSSAVSTFGASKAIVVWKKK